MTIATKHRCKTCGWWEDTGATGNSRTPDGIVLTVNHGWCFVNIDIRKNVSSNGVCGKHTELVRDRENDFIQRLVKALNDARQIDKTYEAIERDS